MKFALASDVHLEFGPLEIKNTHQADVLVLSGDICVATDLQPSTVRLYNDSAASKSNQYYSFFEQCAQEFKHVVYVLGNHEHYHGDFADSVFKLQQCLSYIPNLHILDKEWVELEGVVWFGATLWTDMNGEDPNTMRDIAHCMNDFRVVENSHNVVHYSRQVPVNKPVGVTDREWLNTEYNSRFRVEPATRSAHFTTTDAVEEHKATLFALCELLESTAKPVVVCTHHAPSRTSTHPRYAGEYIMNGGYSSNLDSFIQQYPQIRYWTHGHTHESFEYPIGNTQVVCNPRGYINYESRADYFQLKYYTL